MSVVNFLRKSVENYPSKTALIDEERKITFHELFHEVQKFSSAISFLENKEMISLISENSISFIISYLGIINSGRIVHLVSPQISKNNLRNQLKSSGSAAIICSKTIKKKIFEYEFVKIPLFEYNEVNYNSEKNTNNSKTNELAYLIYTSGTTSDPKGVAISHDMIEFTTKNITKVLGYLNSDVDVTPLPLYHSFGLGCLHTSLFVGSTFVILKNANNLDQLLDSLKKNNATTFAVIPATLTKLLKFHNHVLEDRFSKIRLIITNSTSIPKTTVQNFKEILKNGYLATYYGLTEASRSTFMKFDRTGGKEESVGRTPPGVEIKIANDHLNNSKTGEIWIRGKNVIKKYWNNVEADKKIVDGWLKTGDIGYLDEENYLFLKGRNDDIINIGGEKVMPEEIEDCIKQLSGIKDVVAFGINHKTYGQIIKIHIVKSGDSNIDKSKILTHCIRNLENFKIPSKIDFVESIPRTDYGKVKRFRLK